MYHVCVGKILADDKTVEACQFKEKDFIVLMTSKVWVTRSQVSNALFIQVSLHSPNRHLPPPPPPRQRQQLLPLPLPHQHPSLPQYRLPHPHLHPKPHQQQQRILPPRQWQCKSIAPLAT